MNLTPVAKAASETDAADLEARMQANANLDIHEDGSVSVKPLEDGDEDLISVRNPSTGEHMGPKGREPTRYGDWESKGRCWDF